MSFRLSMCWTLTVVKTSIPASRSSSASCQRLAWRAPGALVCASSSRRRTWGCRVSAPSRSNSRSTMSAIRVGKRGQDLEALQEGLRLPAAMRLDPADDHIDALAMPEAGLLEHGVRLPDAGDGPEKHLEPAAHLPRRLLLEAGQQAFRVGAFRIHDRFRDSGMARRGVTGIAAFRQARLAQHPGPPGSTGRALPRAAASSAIRIGAPGASDSARIRRLRPRG